MTGVRERSQHSINLNWEEYAMFSYQHRYHAGGFSDVHKHICLIAILQALHKKPTPFAVMDAYAGEGVYDLSTKEALKNKEFSTGFLPLLNSPLVSSLPLLSDYIDEIKRINSGNEIKNYPGSGAMIQSYLRPQDRAIFIEKHPQAIQALRQSFKNNKQIQIHERDAIEAMLALVPFNEKRGLIFIDPSYEVKAEYQILPQTIVKIHQRFSNAIIALWYPILSSGLHLNMLWSLNNLNFKTTWQHEFKPHNKESDGLQGSGMYFINLPWKMDEIISEVFSKLN